MSALLEIEGLRVTHDDKPIVDGVDLELASGEALGLAGLERQVDAVEDRPVAVAHLQPADLEQAAHACCSRSRGLTYSSNR